MSMDKWASIQNALAERFSDGSGSVIGGNWLGPLLAEERDYGAALVETYKGFDITEHAFFDFYIETMHLAVSVVR